MHTVFDDNLFKQRVRAMVAFMEEKGVTVPLSLGYEAAARFFFDAKSRNNLASDAKKGSLYPSVLPSSLGLGEPAPEGQLRWRCYLNGREFDSEAFACAAVSTFDGGRYERFSILDELHSLSDEQLLALAASKWEDQALLRNVLEARRGTDATIAEVLQYADTAHVGVTSHIERLDALRFLKAFRPHLLAKAILLEKYGSLENAGTAHARYAVTRVEVNGKDSWQVVSGGDLILPEVSREAVAGTPGFRTEEAAWNVLASDILDNDSAKFNIENLSLVRTGSGYVD